MVLACCHPLIIVLIVRILFIHPELFKSLLSLSSGVHQFRFIHSQFAVIILRSYRCLVQVIFNRLVLSSSHVSKYPKVSSFILQFFPVICAFATFNFNSYGGPFKITFLLSSYQVSHCFPNPTAGLLKTSSSLHYIYLNPFYENKLYAKSIACHQFNSTKDKHTINLILISSE